MTNGLAQIGAVFWKDALTEWRSPGRFVGVMVFAFALVLMVAFASDTTDVMRKQAGGTLWVGLLLASTRSLDQSMAAELDHGALEGLLLLPVQPWAVFLGKALANTVLLLLVGVALTPLSIALFDVRYFGSLGWFAAALVLGSAALSAPGTVLSAITAQARGSSVLLPLLLFPLIVPALLAAAGATIVLLTSNDTREAQVWVTVLAAFNGIQWPLGALLFGYVLEGGSS
jgi:heme exporter protein B